MKHQARLMGGLGSVFLIYAPLRLLESKPAIVFLAAFIGLSYGLGWLLDRAKK